MGFAKLKNGLVVCFLVAIVFNGSCVFASERDTSLHFSFTELMSELFSSNGSGKITPRRLVPAQSGEIVSMSHRLFLQFTPMDINQAIIRIQKTGGKGRTGVTITATDQSNNQVDLHSFEIAKGSGNTGQIWNIPVSGIQDKRLSIYFEGISLFGSMSYTLQLLRPDTGEVWTPEKSGNEEPIKGYADLHNHYMNHLAYAGGMTCGSIEEGDLAGIYDLCEGRHDIDLLGIKLLKGSTVDYGGFLGPAWDDQIVHHSMPGEWLKVAADNGLKLMVVSVVNNEWLCGATAVMGNANPEYVCNDMESIKRQIYELKRFAAKTPWFTIVRDPWEARQAIGRGEIAVVMAVEVSNLFPDSDGSDFKNQLYELYSMGVRSVQLVHQTNSDFMGAAFHPDILTILNQIKAFFKKDIDFVANSDGIHNDIGMSAMGEELLAEMVRLNMLIDVTHSSLVGQRQIYKSISEKYTYYPLFNSHTRIGELLTQSGNEKHKEFVTIDETLNHIRSTGGMIGLRSGADGMIDYTPSKGQKVKNNCDGSARSYIQFYQYADDHKLNVGFASDFMGMCTQLAPRFGKDACAMAETEGANKVDQASAQFEGLESPYLDSIDTENGLLNANYVGYYNEYLNNGLANVSYLPAVAVDMKRLGADTANLSSSAESFLGMWERNYDSNRQKIEPPADEVAFDGVYYLTRNPDVKAAGMDPLVHYNTYGWKEGRNPCPTFDTSKYLQAYPDVANANVNPLRHYINHGRGEGRVAFMAD